MAVFPGCWWSARWLPRLGGGVGEEVIDHAVQQHGEHQAERDPARRR